MEEQTNESGKTSWNTFSESFEDYYKRAHSLLTSRRDSLRQAETDLRDRVNVLIAGEDKRFAEVEKSLDQQRSDLQNRESELRRREAETNSQRRRIARELRAQRSRLLADVESERAKILQASAQEDSQLSQQLTSALLEIDNLQTEVKERKQDAEELQQQIESLQSALASREEEVQPLEGFPDPDVEVTFPDVSDELHELKCKYEAAIEDIRDLREKNEELQRSATEEPASAPRPTPGNNFDWEAQKAALFAEMDDDPALTEQARLEIADVIRRTDAVVAAKDQEITQLRARIEELTERETDQSANDSTAAIAEVLDSDEVIQEERANLKRLQDEWREKLRIAEVDISVERAKLARERSELEDKLQSWESQRGRVEDSKGEKKPARNRWLARLGLRDDEE